MPQNPNWQQDMDAAAATAAEQLDTLLKDMSAEQKQGVTTLVKWLNDHTATAGYKRLCRALRAAKL